MIISFGFKEKISTTIYNIYHHLQYLTESEIHNTIWAQRAKQQ